MKRLLSLVAFFATLHASAQQVNPVPDYVFRNQMSVGRGTVTDTAAYFSIGPRYGANKGFMPPIVGDTATFSSGKRNGLLIFSVQKNKFLYWDSVRVQWSDMAGSSGTYITGTGITGYVPQFSGTTTIDTSALFTLGSRLGIGTSSFAYTSATSSIELNGTAGGILGFKRNDSARGYLWHTGSDMELANTTAGTLSFNTNSATRGSISSAGVWRLHNLAGTGDRVVVASSNGTLSASTSVTGLVDTTTISTRAWRQKGDDSLGAIIATKGSGTVTSVATGYGLSGGTITTTGTLLVDTLNISTRAWRQKGLDSLAALEVSGSGTTNYVPKFTAASTIGNSQIFDNGTNVGVGTASPGYRLTVAGASTAGSVTALAVENPSTNAASEVRQEFRAGGSTWGYITNGYNSNSPFMAFGVSAASVAPTERLRITSGGNVGIGTTNPIQKFVVSNSGSEGFEFVPGASSNSNQLLSYNRATSAYSDLVTRAATYNIQIGTTNAAYIFANGRVGVNTTTDAGYQFDINGTLRSVNGANFATTSGNVGIGTASPGVKLDVSGDVRASGSLVIGTGGSTEAGAIFSNANFGFWFKSRQASPVVAHYQFGDNSGNSLALINPAGELLINTTTDAGDYKLQVAGAIYNTSGAVFAASGGNVGIGTTSATDSYSFGKALDMHGSNGAAFYMRYATDPTVQFGTIGYDRTGLGLYLSTNNALPIVFYTSNTQRGRINSAGEWLLNADGTDAGDYKLQVVGNARVGTGKLDISSNTVFGLGVSRSGTSEVAGQIYNSSGILYTGVEGSAGGAIFTGSSAYAAVIGSGAAYPLQFATNNVTRATINADGEMLIGGTDVGLYNLQVTGNAYTQTFQYVGNVLGINTGTYNSAGTAQITMKNGTNPDGSVTDQFILYSADVVAGNAAPHFRTENGGIIKLYQETTAVGAATFTANSGTAVNDASTFDGYTLKQIVKALRNQGILQ